MRRIVLVWIALALLPAVLAGESNTNIVILLADDLGYGDVACYNPQSGKIKTPHLDALAAEGMRFTDAHTSSAVCSPTRYALLTGRYHWRTRLQSGIVGLFDKPLIAADRMTVATLAKQRGYTTACIGKWHLGWDWPLDEQTIKQTRALGGKPGGGGKAETEAPEGLREAWRKAFALPIAGGPTARGFDRYFGTDVPNWPPYCYIENDRTVGIPSEVLGTEGLKKDLASLQGPALKDWRFDPILAALGDRAEQFIAEQAAAKKPFLLYMPFTSPHTPIAPGTAWAGKSGLGSYADLVMETDATVGRILAALKQHNLADNTLVVFSSDNGFASYIEWKTLKESGHTPSGPLRGFKSSVYEGGTRVPFIVRWPGVVAPGSVCKQLVHQADLFSTVAEIFGIKVPDNAGEDSVSLLPVLKDPLQKTRNESVSCAANGQPGFRQGAWKYIPPLNGDAPPELYNLDEDLAESRNRAQQEPERVKALAEALEKIITQGRSTPGAPQSNDIKVHRFPKN